MALSVLNIINLVRTQLIDSGEVKRWSDNELRLWVNEARRAVCTLVPQAYSKTASMLLKTGTRQNIPTDGHMLLKVDCNTNATGTVLGRTVRLTTRELLDGFDRDWQASSSNAVADAYTYDPAEPTIFYVYPPSNNTGYVRVVYGALPDEILEGFETLPIQISDTYAPALVNYVLYRAHQKDSDFAAGAAMADKYYQLFMAHMGQRPAAELANNPNLTLGEPNPSITGAAK